MRRNPPAQETSQTSVDAAIAIQLSVGSIDHEVLSRIRQAPCTDQEGQESTGIKGDTWRPSRRRHELAGRIIADGTRRTRSGRQAVVWRISRANEPPGTRRSAGDQTGAPHQAVATGQRQAQRTRKDPLVPGLWIEVWDCRPSWMTVKAHRKIVNAALEQHAGDTGAGLRLALRELREQGGGR